MSMKLTIISPKEVIEHSIVWLEITTNQGNFVIQAEHAPTLFTLAQDKPISFCLKNGKQESLFIKNGVVEISRKSALILLSEFL